MSLSLLVEAVFVILALALVVNTFWPSPFGWPGPRAPWPRSLLWLLLELVVLAVVYWVVRILFLGDSVPLRALSPSPFAAGLFLAAISPTPPPVPSSTNDAGGYVWKYVLNAALILGSLISAVGTFLTMNPQVNAAWLGVSDVSWHWGLLVIGVLTIAYNAVTHAPPLTAPPTAARMAVERNVHAIRRSLVPPR